MPVIRLTLFNKVHGYGFSESYWLNRPETNLAAYSPIITSLAQKRAPLGGTQSFVQYGRVSAEGIFRDSLVVKFPGGGFPGDPNAASAAPQLALLLAMKNDTFVNQSITYLRGFWDAVSVDGGTYVPVAGYVGIMNGWIDWLVNEEYGWYGVLSKEVGFVTDVTQNANGTVTLTTIGDVFAAPFNVPRTVNISGVQGAFQVNGAQVVVPTSATTCTTARRIAVFDYTTGGKISNPTRGYIRFNRGDVLRVVERKPGRPSYLSRGRRRARAAS